jgi:uncharacterized delta-60 repeat protein
MGGGGRKQRAFVAVVVATTVAVSALALVARAAAPEGSLDPAFSGDGVVTTPAPAGMCCAHGAAVAVQPDGKVVVAGTASNGTNDDFAVARYDRNGSLDPTFGNGGIVTTQVRRDADDRAAAVAIQPNGKIVVAGTTHDLTSGKYSFAVARYRPDGSLDPLFSRDGKQTTAVGAGQNGATSIALQLDGKIVVAGTTYPLTGSRFAVVRYRSRGGLDTTFGHGSGFTNILMGSTSAFAFGNAVALQPDGKIVVAGRIQRSPFVARNDGIGVARLNPDGTRDMTFAGKGRTSAAIGSGQNGAYAVGIQPGGRIVAAGWAGKAIGIAGFAPDGSLDKGFGFLGVNLTAIGTTADVGRALAIQPDGKIVVAGATAFGASGDESRFAVVRYGADGRIDPQFGTAGIVATTVGAHNDQALAVAIQRDGRIVAAGFSATSGPGLASPEIALVRHIGDSVVPTDGRMIGLPRFSARRAPRIRWTANDDNTGVKRYDVRVRSAGLDGSGFGPYSAFRSGTRRASAELEGTPGRTYCFGVRPRDWAGNLGGWGARSCTTFPLDVTAFAVSGSWSAAAGPGYYLGTARTATAAGSTLTVSGSYRRLALVATKCPGCGTVEVVARGQRVATVDLGALATVRRVVIPLDSSQAPVSGSVVVRVTSNGRPVTIEGLGLSQA